jgi:predicted transglutaminase-like cysteine proteinase
MRNYDRINALPRRASSAWLRELDEVNRWVNQSIRLRRTWTTMVSVNIGRYRPTLRATVQGDCEDYVLLERHMLMQRGDGPQALF